jgi:hypothetical protein
MYYNEVDGSKMVTNLMLLGYETRKQCKDISIKSIKVIAKFLMIFGAHVNILFIIKVKYFVLINWSYRFFQL